MAFGIRTLLLFLLASSALLAADTNSAPETVPRLFPPRGAMPPTFWEQNAAWVLVAAVLLLALGGLGAWYLGHPKPTIAMPPEVRARQALEALAQQPEDGQVLSRVSQILKGYFAEAFGLPSGEMTTAEFCRALAEHKQPGPELQQALPEFLHRCDQRKFAPIAPQPALRAVPQALKLVELGQARVALLRPPVESPSTSNKGEA